MVAASEPSLHSFAPNGPSGSMLSTMIGSTSGDSTEDGLRYSSNPGFMSRPSFQIISSVSAWPMPIQTEPIICPSTETGLRARPQSCAAQTLWTVTAGVFVDTDFGNLCGVRVRGRRADARALVLAAAGFG